MGGLRLLCIATCLFALSACASDVRIVPTEIDAADIQIVPEQQAFGEKAGEDDLLIVSGVWRRGHLPMPGATSQQAVPVAVEQPKPIERERAVDRLAARAPRRNAPPRHTMPLPRYRHGKPRRIKGQRTTRRAEDLAREHVLDFPTHIVAERITFYCPQAFAREVQLTGTSVRTISRDRRMATGKARLLCRELTLEGSRITLRVIHEPAAALRVTARGGVQFISRVHDQVQREENVRSLLVTNDEVVPLR